MTLNFITFFCTRAARMVVDGEPHRGLAARMYDAHLQNLDMPVAVDVDGEDSPNVRRIKELILEMTSFESKDRPTSKDVQHDVSSIYRSERKAKVKLYNFVQLELEQTIRFFATVKTVRLLHSRHSFGVMPYLHVSHILNAVVVFFFQYNSVRNHI